MSETCTYSVAWVGKCGEPAVEGDRCEKHHDLKCAGCGVTAVKSCDHTGIQFVCGAPLCAGCMHHPPAPDSPNLFGMGGGHSPVAEAMKAWDKTWG